MIEYSGSTNTNTNAKNNFFLRICENTNTDHLVVPYDPPFPPRDIKGKIFQNSLVMIPVQSR